MRITQLVLEKVACFDRLTIDFQNGRDPSKADIHLIVGANGTGKSTVLIALAQFFSQTKTGLEKRFAESNGLAVLQTEDQSHLISGRGRVDSSQYNSLFSIHPKEIAGTLRLFSRDERLFTYGMNSSLHIEAARLPPLSFAAFAYSGLRSTAAFRLNAIQEQTENPLANALNFDNPNASKDLIQWVANTKAKEAFARTRGDEIKADQRKESITRIERIVSDIIDQPFGFILNEDPLGILVEVDGKALDIELLPDGLKSILSWAADLLMRLDRLPWENDIPVLDRPFLLFLDEIEVHLHPAWQRKILPAIQTLFPNAQIFVSTHSPFVIASADDAWIYPLTRKGRYSALDVPIPSMKGNSYATILRDALGMDASFSVELESLFDRFYQARDEALGGNEAALSKMNMLQEELSAYGAEVSAVVVPEMRQTHRRLNRSKGDPQ